MKAINLKEIMKVYEEMIRERNWRLSEERDRRLSGKLVMPKASEKEVELERRFNELCRPLDETIRIAEGRATVRTIYANRIVKSLYDVTKRFDITKKAMDGIKVHYDYHAQRFPQAYKYRADSTHFKAEYKNGSWRVTDIYRDGCGTQRCYLNMTEEAKKAILERVCDFG